MFSILILLQKVGVVYLSLWSFENVANLAENNNLKLCSLRIFDVSIVTVSFCWFIKIHLGFIFVDASTTSIIYFEFCQCSNGLIVEILLIPGLVPISYNLLIDLYYK